MTDLIRHISSPSELTNPSSETPSSKETPPPQAIQIHLLAPLSDAETLAQCQSNNGPASSEHKYLDISSLSKRWRATWAEFPATATLDKVVFDLSMPEPTAAADDAQGVYWATRVPGKQGIGVVEMEAIRLVITMATTMSMRSGKQTVFEVTGDGYPDCPYPGNFAELRQILQGLSKPHDGAA